MLPAGMASSTITDGLHLQQEGVAHASEQVNHQYREYD